MHMATSITPFRGLLIGLLVHAAQATVAQSVGRVEMLPVVGATWHMRALQRIPELPQVVRPVVWPFADLEGNDVFGITYTMRDAAEVPLAAAYPEADQVLHAVPDDGSPATDIVLDVQPDRCLELLSTTSPVSCVYNPGALLAAYPLAFGAEMGVDHCFMTVSSSALTPYCGTTWITFERTGLLQLPFGEYPEANLIRTRRSKVNASEPSDSSMTETLTWYAEGSPIRCSGSSPSATRTAHKRMRVISWTQPPSLVWKSGLLLVRWRCTRSPARAWCTSAHRWMASCGSTAWMASSCAPSGCVQGRPLFNWTCRILLPEAIGRCCGTSAKPGPPP